DHGRSIVAHGQNEGLVAGAATSIGRGDDDPVIADGTWRLVDAAGVGMDGHPASERGLIEAVGDCIAIGILSIGSIGKEYINTRLNRWRRRERGWIVRRYDAQVKRKQVHAAAAIGSAHDDSMGTRLSDCG